MKRSNSVWLFVVSLSLLSAPALTNALAEVESRTPPINSMMGDEAEYVGQEPIGLYERPRRSEPSYHERPKQERSERSSRSSYSRNSAASSSEDRVAHLTLKQMETLERELSELRGLVETQEHEIARLKKSQQDFYLDLDKRISQSQSAGNKPAEKGKKPSSVYSTVAPDATAKPTAAKTAVSPPAVSASPATKPNASQKPVNSVANLPAAKGKQPQTPIGIIQTAPPKAANNKKGSPLASAGAQTAAPVGEAPVQADLAQGSEDAAEEVDPVAIEAPPTLSSAAAAATSAKPQSGATEKTAYEAAYKLVRSKQYPEAIQGLQNYLAQYAKGEHAPNAHYWIGEVYMVQWQNNKADNSLLDHAALSFQNVTNQFPSHQKATDALLKLGIIENERGNLDAAKHYLSEVKTHHPGTAAARIAETKLKQLN